MAKMRLGSGVKLTALALGSLLLSGCYKIEVKETLNLDGTSDIAIKIDMSAMMSAMTGMAEGMAQGFTEMGQLGQEAIKPADVRNASTILKTARAVESISTFDPEEMKVADVLWNEGAFELNPDHDYYYGYIPGKGETEEGFFVLTCPADETNKEAYFDGSRAVVEALSDNGLCPLSSPEELEVKLLTKGMLGRVSLIPSSLDEAQFTSCKDPALLTELGIEGFGGEFKTTEAVEITKTVSCVESQEENTLNIIERHSDTPADQTVVQRRGNSCNDPAILLFYQVEDFSTPITETYTVNETVSYSCGENSDDIVVSVTRASDQENSPLKNETLVFPKAMETEISMPSNSDLILEDEAGLVEDDDHTGSDKMTFCDESEQNPEEMPYFFTSCEDIAPGVGIMHFTKYDTTGFKVNPNGTVTYDLSPSTKPVKKDFDEGLQEESQDDSMMMDPSAMGFAVDYVIVSPWPIIEYSAGTLEDEYTLRVNLLNTTEDQKLSVTLDTDGNTLDLISPRTQAQIDQLIITLKDKLQNSEAPMDKQLEYLHALSKKIQKVAEIRPDNQVVLGYLQTQLIQLAEELQAEELESMEMDFMTDLEALTEMPTDTEDEVEVEAEAAPEEEMMEDEMMESEEEMLMEEEDEMMMPENETTETQPMVMPELNTEDDTMMEEEMMEPDDEMLMEAEDEMMMPEESEDEEMPLNNGGIILE